MKSWSYKRVSPQNAIFKQTSSETAMSYSYRIKPFGKTKLHFIRLQMLLSHIVHSCNRTQGGKVCSWFCALVFAPFARNLMVLHLVSLHSRAEFTS
jgi:hypothetical protein